jgi:hypothetical protein
LDSLDKGQDDANREIVRCLEILERTVADLISDLGPVTIWIARVGDSEMDEAWSHLLATTQAFQGLAYRSIVGDKAREAVRLDRDALPGMDDAITVLSLRSLNLLGMRDLTPDQIGGLRL